MPQTTSNTSTTSLLSGDIAAHKLLRGIWKEATGQYPMAFFADLGKQPSLMADHFPTIEKALMACMGNRPIKLLRVQKEPGTNAFRMEYNA